ncbi:MAG: WD40/YVTN/BNR-like repeat-containing protein, partial [Thermoflexus sp.]
RWRWAARGRYRLSPSLDESSVLALNEESPSQALLISIGSESPMHMPAPVLDVAGDFQRANRWLVRSPLGSVGLYQKDQGTIEWTLRGPIASVSISPAFPTDGVVLAGGFRSGIFRSTDGGQHWEQVLAQPSTVIPGSDEIYEIVFLSPTNVLAIQGGRTTWQ